MKIPKEQMEVVKELRKRVPNTYGMLCLIETFSKVQVPRWKTEGGHCMCPLGFHPDALCPTPFHSGDFKSTFPLDEGTIQNFATWWDSLNITDAVEVADQIWKSWA